MRIAIIGPAHPYKGGIAQHTTELAHRLSGAGHEVEIISWRTQYPFFYPGEQFVPQNKPELPTHPGTKRVLSWRNPAGWGRWGRRLRSFDQLIFIWWVPTFQGPVYWGMLRALGRQRPPVTVICHNVLPHEPRPGDRTFARAVLRRCERVIVHSESQAELAEHLSGKSPILADLPLVMLDAPKRAVTRRLSKNLLLFGFVRPYKGLDVLLEALTKTPDITLTVAGEFWGGPKPYEQLIKRLRLQRRVTLRDGYVPADDLADYIAGADAVVLPYKSGTASWNVHLAHAYGTPVIATRVGSLPVQVHDGVDGLLCEPGDATSLAEAINRFYKRGVAKKLQEGVPEIPVDKDWERYLQAVIGG
ncbi:MAG TPA: glycosyltransferase [Verrucomicrobiae bacterium]|nr:glycosyltransferase [Verrucomicrobiae bacterium]